MAQPYYEKLSLKTCLMTTAAYIKRWLKRQLPPGMLLLLRKRYALLRYQGTARYCPACDTQLGRFIAGGEFLNRPEARCPACGALERHRLIALFFREWSDLFSGGNRSMLHFSPEAVFEQQFRHIPELDYLTADLSDPRVMVRMDISAIPYPDHHFDIIYCSHVLEHVPDDRQAMRELRRVLKPSGWAVLQVPVTVETTVEDPTVTDPQERLRLFGQEDHVRRYGIDYPQRLEAAGFRVLAIPAERIAGEARVARLGLDGDEKIFFCTPEENAIYRQIRDRMG